MTRVVKGIECDAKPSEPERGISMIELIIGMAIGVLVMTLAVLVLRTAISTQAVVTSSTAAATRAQTIGNLIDVSVRQAVGTRGIKVSSDGGLASNRLDVRRAAVGSSGWICETFAVEPGADGRLELYYRKLAVANGVTTTTGNAYATWTRLLSWGAGSTSATLAVTPVAGTPYFSAVGSSAVDASGTGTGARYAMTLNGADARLGAPAQQVVVRGTVRQRAMTGSAAACFS